ncbi:hypothetical protein FHS19_005454 [Paenibacillus rhizosphaerae]|uniref:Uncharacterized protein n=1 Tax=Paenibacillus rhizosphaerae TaxID=297318 RepID=A0A839TV67_9BACL|nr:hypothetical protein [Paenibacillus rhizosphaerae]MBB3130735.1 hypothetical protein [Paenibacillus rhizosphaerae]
MSKIHTRLVMVPVMLYVICLLIGCSHASSASSGTPSFRSAEQAVEYGLHEEQVELSNVLTTITVDGEELIFYEKDGAFGVGGVNEGPSGYQWYRSSPYLNFEGEDTPYMTGGFTVRTSKGQDVNILAGKVFDPKITGMSVQGDHEAQELSITGRSRFFFTVHQSPFSELEVTPVLAAGAVGHPDSFH